MLRNPTFLTGAVMVAIVVMTAVASYWYTPRDVFATNVAARYTPPGSEFVLGTDRLGRDLLSRIMRGAAIAMFVGAGAVVLAVVIGVTLGAVAGLYGGWLDEGAMRVVDALTALPPIMLAVLLITVTGPGLVGALLAIGIANSPVFARLVRAGILSLREVYFVEAAHALGAGKLRIVWLHMLPNMIGPLTVQATITFSMAIILESSMSFLGLGTQPPNPSWGLMLNDAQRGLRLAPWLAIFPGLAICWTVLGLNLLGDGLRDILDPKLSNARPSQGSQ